jgi:DNA repair protein RecO (recombination protein O)
LYQPLDCIALRTIRYSDRNAILTAYTKQLGRLSFLLPAGTGKVAARLRALLMPLGRFECVADIRPGREVHPIHDVRGVIFPPAADPLRSTLALFIADILTSLLREPMADPLLFDFIDDALRRLSPDLRGEALHGNALLNFHICFLIRLTRFLGIEPDWATYREGYLLDLADGIFRQLPPVHRRFLPEGESAAAHRLSRINFRNAHLFRLSRFDRNLILDRILLYYQTHFPSLSEPTSLSILRMLSE